MLCSIPRSIDRSKSSLTHTAQKGSDLSIEHLAADPCDRLLITDLVNILGRFCGRLQTFVGDISSVRKQDCLEFLVKYASDGDFYRKVFVTYMQKLEKTVDRIDLSLLEYRPRAPIPGSRTATGLPSILLNRSERRDSQSNRSVPGLFARLPMLVDLPQVLDYPWHGCIISFEQDCEEDGIRFVVGRLTYYSLDLMPGRGRKGEMAG